MNEKTRQKKCLICGEKFKPYSKRSRFCEKKTCKRRGYYLESVMRKKGINRLGDAISIKDRKEADGITARELALAASPDISKLVAVPINRRTVIYIHPGKSIAHAKQKFISKYQN